MLVSFCKLCNVLVNKIELWTVLVSHCELWKDRSIQCTVHFKHCAMWFNNYFGERNPISDTSSAQVKCCIKFKRCGQKKIK